MLASIPLGVAALSGLVACQSLRERVFGLATSGLDADAVQRSVAVGRQLGRRPGVINVYDAFAWRQRLPTDVLARIDSVGSLPEITWEPWDPAAGPEQSLYAPAQIAGGRFDSYVAQWASDAVEYGRRLLIRFAHEMNGNWYPWAVGASKDGADEYVAAFRRIRRIFDDAGADQVQWVWSPNVIINGDSDVIRRCYPGKDFVDIIGVDGYNFGDDGAHRWTSPSGLFAGTLELCSSIAPNKPVWINEVGCTDVGGNKAEWITGLFDYLRGTSVSGLVWFEADKPDEPDWRLTSTAETTAAAKGALEQW